MKFTAKNTGALPLPADRTKSEAVYFDDDLPGFGLRCRQGGSRSWIFQYELGGKQTVRVQKRMTFGKFPALSPDKARSIAADLHAKVRLGQDPASEKVEGHRRVAETFGAEAEKFLKAQKARLRPGSYSEVERHILRHARPLHKLPITAVNRRTIADLLTSIGDESGAVASNRVRSSLSAFFAWMIKGGRVELNPVAGTGKFDEAARERVLSADELGAIWRAAGDDHYGSIVRLLMLTAQRADEIASLRWSEIGAGAINLPKERTKNGEAHLVPLSTAALAIIEAQPRRTNADGTLRDFIFGLGQRGFSGWSRCKERLDERIAKAGKPLSPWVLHDLRRTAVTGMATLGVLPHVIEATVNHVSGHKAGVAGVYNYATYEPEKRQALDRWAAHVTAIVEGKTSNITVLKRA